MEPFPMTSAVWLAVGGFVFVAVLWAVRLRRPVPTVSAAAPETLIHRVELRMESIETMQSTLGARIEALGGGDAPERRLQAMAGQILSLVRDKNASLDTALAGLEQIRVRLRVLEQIGAPAEALALLERLGARLDAVDSRQATIHGALEARLAAIEGATPPFAEISGQLTRLHAQKDATMETVFARLAPLEAKLGDLENLLAARDPGAALARFAERLEATRAAQEAAASSLGDRLEGLQGRVVGLETVENPFAEISDQLTRLHAQKDATMETVFARLAPLEARLGELERAEGDEGAAAARAEAQAIAIQLIAARTVAEETRLFANRISLLETSLPRLSMAQALMMQALERQAAPSAPDWSAPGGVLEGASRSPGRGAAEETEEDALWRLPRVVSVHKS
jgi:DNA repair exonuclease SbcCD ATPase subunit